MSAATTEAGGADSRAPSAGPIFDISGIDLSQRLVPRSEIERYNPHRGMMSLLDAVIWASPDHSRCVAIKHVEEDEFWVAGHFPGRPMFPGVLMIEAGAQLSCYSFLKRNPGPKIAAFLRIESAAFRNMVKPGDDLIVLCRDVKIGRRQFASDVQGLVAGRVAFDARISGMSMPA